MADIFSSRTFLSLPIIGSLIFAILTLSPLVFSTEADRKVVWLKRYHLNWEYSPEANGWYLDSLNNDPIPGAGEGDLEEINDSELVGLLRSLRDLLTQFHRNPKDETPTVSYSVVRRPHDRREMISLERYFDGDGLKNRYYIYDNFFFVFLFDVDPLDPVIEPNLKDEDYYKFYPDGTIGHPEEKQALDFTKDDGETAGEKAGDAEAKDEMEAKDVNEVKEVKEAEGEKEINGKKEVKGEKETKPVKDKNAEELEEPAEMIRSPESAMTNEI